MQVPSFRAGYGVVRLRPNQLVAKLETTLHLAEHALLHESSKGLACGRGRELHDRVEREIRQSPAEHSGEIERCARWRTEPSQLALEHVRDGARDAEGCGRLRVQRLEIAQEGARSVLQPLFGEEFAR